MYLNEKLCIAILSSIHALPHMQWALLHTWHPFLENYPLCDHNGSETPGVSRELQPCISVLCSEEGCSAEKILPGHEAFSFAKYLKEQSNAKKRKC